MKHKKYIYTSKKHSEKAIMSMNLGIISTISLMLVVWLTYRGDGEATVGYGVTGLLAMIFSLIGLVMGLLTMGERDCFKLFPVLGVLFNGVALGGVAFLFWMGL